MDPDRLMRNMLQIIGMDGSMPGPGGMFGGMMAPHPMTMMGHPLSAAPMMGHPQLPSLMMGHPLMAAPMMGDPFGQGGFMNASESRPRMMYDEPFGGIPGQSVFSNRPSGFSRCSSTLTRYTIDKDGRPQVYQQSQEIKSGPDGLRETRSSIRDSRTGHQEIKMGLHLHDKAHIKKKTKNVYTGYESQEEELVNLEESEAEGFDREWRDKYSGHVPNSRHYNNNLPAIRPRNNRLALTSSAHGDGGESSAKKLHKKVVKKKKKSSSVLSSSESKEVEL